MKIISYITVLLVLFSIGFTACDDNLNSVGDNILPDNDGINVAVDTVGLKARTIFLKDSVYARTNFGLLGQYDDPIFGRVKSDYLTELYCPEAVSFKDKTISIDSVYLSVEIFNFTGDSISPMGISAYPLKENLKANFFTNTDPAKYANLNKILGQSVFNIHALPKTSSGSRIIKTVLSKSLGQDFYNEWKRPGSTTFNNSDELKKFFKGFYVTTTFGAGTLVNVASTSLNIYYTYTGRNTANTADSTMVSIFRLSGTPEVIQMNHIKNTIPQSQLNAMLADSLTKTYLKTPAGFCTELTIPLNKIINNVGSNRIINAANFSLKEFTEAEQASNLNRPSYLLFVNRDSIANFFLNQNLPNNKTSFIISRNSANNTYGFGNYIASIINYYADYYKTSASMPDLKYLLIPVQVTPVRDSNGNITGYSGVYNQMNPTSAILRTDESNMKLSLVYSQYNNRK